MILRELRKERGLSQYDLARLSGCHIGVITKLERGQTRDPYWSTVKALARALEVSLDDLVARENAAEREVVAQAPPVPRRKPRER